MMVMMCRPGCRRTEDGQRLKVRNLFAIEHLFHGDIRRNPYHLVHDLDRKMEIPQLPRHTRRVRRDIAEGNFEDGLLPLANRIENALLSQHEIAMGKQMIKVEAKLPAVARDGSPAALCEDFAIHRDGDDAIGFRPVDMQVMTDNFHTQNKKYLWAIGKTSAGAQRSSTPSAFTV